MRRIYARVGAVASAAIVIACVLAAVAPASSAKTVWLCLPGHAPDPCTPGLSTTVYTPKLEKLGVEHPQRVKAPAIDCFYVYPTVSNQPTGNSNLVIGPSIRPRMQRHPRCCPPFVNEQSRE